MRLTIFLSGILIVATGILGISQMPKMPGFEFLRGAVTLGGALVICGIFTVRMYWHGLIGAGVVALLGAGKGILGLKDFPSFLTGDRSRGIAPVMEIGIIVICVALVLRVVRVLMAERARRMFAQGENQRGG